MFQKSLLVSAVALTLTACGPEDVRDDFDSSFSVANGSDTTLQDESSGNTSDDTVTDTGTGGNTDESGTEDSSDADVTEESSTTEQDSNDADETTTGTGETGSESETDESNETTDETTDNSGGTDSTVDNADGTDGTDGNDNTTDGTDATAETAPAFVNGNSYANGDQVTNLSSVYQCDVAGWCSLGADAYIPGQGYAWNEAWSLVGSAETGTDTGTGDNTDSTDTTDTDETGSGENTDSGSGDDSENGNDADSENGSGTTDGSGTDDSSDTTGGGHSEGGVYTTDLDTTGWPKPLQENNRPYSNPEGNVVGTYFVEWGVYGRDYHVADMPSQNLTHILYGFIPICGPNDSLKASGSAYNALQQQCADKQDYEVTIHDEYAALEKSYPGDTWDQDVRGNFGQLMRMKATNPDLIIMPSVGGWTLSDPFFYMDDPAKRNVFVASVKEFLLTWDFFDGVDIDWEFPGGGGASAALGQPSDAQTYVILMRELRAMLDEVEAETGRDMELTSAIGTSPRFITAVDYANAAPYMDYIFMMTYDYKGAWSSELGHQTNLYASQMTADDSLSLEISVQEMLKQNVDPAKLVLGVAKYGRGWGNVTGVSGNNPFAGTGGGALNESGYWEAGIMDYKLIESRYLGGDPEGAGVNGWTHGWDDVAQASYLWNPAEQKLISFDSARSTRAKGLFAQQQNLGGLFSWEIDADNGHILNAMHEGLGHPQQ